MLSVPEEVRRARGSSEAGARMAYFREATPYQSAHFSKHESDLYDLEDAEEIIGEHSEVLEVGEKWAVVSVADYSRAIVFKSRIRRGSMAPIRKMKDYLQPGFKVIVSARRVKKGDSDARKQQCGWVVTKIQREDVTISSGYYKQHGHLFDFMTKGGMSDDSDGNQLGPWTGEAIKILCDCLNSWNSISLAGLMDNLQDADPTILDGLDSIEALQDFIESQPRFFSLTSQGFAYRIEGHTAECVENEIKSRLPRLRVECFGDSAVIIRKPWHIAAVIKPIIQDEDFRVVAFDTERTYYNNSDYVSTVQIAILDEDLCKPFIFDVIDWSDKNFKTSKLKQLLESDRVLKIVHDCRGDSAALENHNIELRNVFDTAVAYTTITEQCNVGYTPPTNFTQLCEMFGRFTPQRNSKVVYQGNQNFWAQRPLTRNMIDHAASDVMGLATHVYDNIKSFMNPAWQSRFDALCTKSLGH